MSIIIGICVVVGDTGIGIGRGHSGEVWII